MRQKNEKKAEDRTGLRAGSHAACAKTSCVWTGAALIGFSTDRHRMHVQRLTSQSSHSPFLSLSRSRSKTRGLGAGRKLRNLRREQRWADKDFNKANLGSEWKKPFAGCSHAKGIVLEKL